MKKILLLGATFGTGNMGVGALAAGALTIVAKRFPGAQVSLLDYGKHPVSTSFQVGDRTLDVPLVNLRFSWKLFLPNNVALLLLLSAVTRLFGRGFQLRLGRANRWLSAIDDADLALAVSGGDSFSDIYGLSRFFYVTLPQWLVVLRGRPLVLLPQTIGPFEGDLTRRMARDLMRRARLICSRDAEGVVEARRMVGEGGPAALFCPDMGFVVEPHLPKRFDAGGFDLRSATRPRPVVGLNVSGLLLIGGYTKSNMFKLNVDYSELVDRLVTEFIDKKDADVLLIPHVFGTDDESDTFAVETVHARLSQRFPGRLHCVRGSYDQNEIKHVIGQCDFFVGSRMHACIAALSQSVPAVGVAYSDKFSGVFATVGVPELIADPRKLSIEQTVSTIAQAYEDRAMFRTRLQSRVPPVQAQVLNLLAEVE